MPQTMREKEELHLIIFSCALVVEQIIYKSVQMYKNYEGSRYLFVTFSQNVIFINCSSSFFPNTILSDKNDICTSKNTTKTKKHLRTC